MKEYFTNKIVNYILKYHDGNMDILRYGCEGLVIIITKTVFIFITAGILNSIDKTIMLILLFAMIRLPAFGLHLKNSFACLIVSVILFALIPFYLQYLNINTNTKLLLNLTSFICIILYAPADTYKRPIYHRKVYKALSIISAIILIIISKTNILALYALILEAILINPITYFLLKLPYGNYERR